MLAQDAAAAPAAAGMGGSGYENGLGIGDDGLTDAQRQVKSVMDSDRHQANPDGLTVDQACPVPLC